MSGMYCYCADFKEGLAMAERSSITTSLNGFMSECGFTPVDFGYGERCLIVYTIADSPRVAEDRLTAFLDAQGWKPVPFPIDWTKAQMLASILYSSIRSQHLITAMFENASKIDLTKIKNEVNRKINQNLKWNRRFEKLKKEIQQYERHPDQDLFIRIMDECDALRVLPEYKSKET